MNHDDVAFYGRDDVGNVYKAFVVDAETMHIVYVDWVYGSMRSMGLYTIDEGLNAMERIASLDTWIIPTFNS